MLHRRRFLQVGMAAASWVATQQRPLQAKPWNAPEPGEDLFAWMKRHRKDSESELYRQLLGAANEFKEGDAIVGVAAESVEHRQLARELLSHTTLRAIDANPPFRDNLSVWIHQAVQPDGTGRLASMTLGQLKQFLLEQPETEIDALRPGLSSDVIACVTKLLSNDELKQIGAKVFNPLPGTRLGARGYMGARIQPNSPTDHPDDIRWQVFDAFSYAVGDVLLGTNPVSSEVESVAVVEKALQDILVTFGIDTILPHCVLAHIDVQAAVESAQPGSTALWFQSIAGSDRANATFDLTLEKMIRHAQGRSGRYGLYFETGQGADFTNGHGQGTDMVIHESRKYGFARALQQLIQQTRRQKTGQNEAWVHLNDVAGFIGPEVFRTREQLVRCCLEDIVMGKLHGLMIGLDICTTLHMDVTLDDLGWCIDQIMPANPGYLMALPTRIDPMLGYLTTSYQDHVHVREKFGFRVEDRMWSFFQSLGVIDQQGRPTAHFGDPAWVYLAYCRRQGDGRSDEQIRAEAEQKMGEVRKRGVFLAERFGASPSQLAPELASQVERIYTDAKACIWAELPADFSSTLPHAFPLETQAADRHDYILHPTSGERLAASSLERLRDLKLQHGEQFDTLLVLSDGLNALAATTDQQAVRLIHELHNRLAAAGFRVAPESLLVHAGRVRAGYQIGETMFEQRRGMLQMVHLIGERPGTGHRTLSIYLTSAPGMVWSQPGRVDHNITKVVSGIATTALSPAAAAEVATRLLRAVT